MLGIFEKCRKIYKYIRKSKTTRNIKERERKTEKKRGKNKGEQEFLYLIWRNRIFAMPQDKSNGNDRPHSYGCCN
jgi:hypothetical protein